MNRFARWRPSPATVISLISLFVALGGTAYAVASLPKNSVGSAQVINGSLQSVDLSRQARTSLKGEPHGEQGPKGDPGPAGALIATRIHNVGQTTSGAWSQETLWPLTGGDWTQAAGALNLLVGQATIKVPAACGSASVPPGGQFLFPAGYVTVLVDGEQLALGLAIFTPSVGGPGNAGQSIRVPLSFNPIFPPAAATSHTLTVKVKDGCGGAGQDFTFESLEIDVVGVG